MKRRKAKRKLTDKQALIIIISVLCAVALLIGALVLIDLLSDEDPTDPHAGHNHAAGEECTDTDPHAGHNHGTTANTDAKVKYQLYQDEGGTYRLVFRDNAGKTLAEHKGLTKQPIKTTIDETKGVYELGWATDNGPNDFECIYYNEKTGQVSDKFVAPRGTDGVRIAYGSADQKSVIVQDLFDSNGYHKEYALQTPTANKDGDIITGGTLQGNKKAVTISYLAGPDAKKDNRHIIINLYE